MNCERANESCWTGTIEVQGINRIYGTHTVHRSRVVPFVLDHFPSLLGSSPFLFHSKVHINETSKETKLWAIIESNPRGGFKKL